MTSAIVRTNPTSGTATTSSVRDNFGSAADEINVLQRSSTDLKPTTGGTISYAVNFGSSPTFSLVDGARISVRINATNTAAPTIIVSPGSTDISIVKPDGSALAAGDLIADNIYELMYNATNAKWVAMNIGVIASQDALLTTILGGLYPVGGLLTTTNSANPGDADYFFSGITFGTWEAYAQGRTIVGIDTGTAITLASSTSNVVTLTVASHSLSAGDLIAVSGFTSDTDANGEFTVDSTTSTTIIYTAANVSDGNLTGSSLLVKNAAFDTAQEVGGESSHTLTQEELAEHKHHAVNPGTGGNYGPVLNAQRTINYKAEGDMGDRAYYLTGDTNTPDRGLTGSIVGDTGGAVTAGQAHNNLQPYITTYIWKRVVTP